MDNDSRCPFIRGGGGLRGAEGGGSGRCVCRVVGAAMTWVGGPHTPRQRLIGHNLASS